MNKIDLTSEYIKKNFISKYFNVILALTASLDLPQSDTLRIGFNRKDQPGTKPPPLYLIPQNKPQPFPTI